jgi:hypothetical protein
VKYYLDKYVDGWMDMDGWIWMDGWIDEYMNT